MVPLFGDMQIAPFHYIKCSPHYEASRWPLASANSPSPQSDLLQHLPAIRDDYERYISELARHSNEVGSREKQPSVCAPFFA